MSKQEDHLFGRAEIIKKWTRQSYSYIFKNILTDLAKRKPKDIADQNIRGDR
jgi:hypothetical protein